jgi:hypothetical protein
VHPYPLVGVLQLLGSAAALCVLRGRYPAFCVASGLLWGLALHAFLALPPLLVAYVLGRPPLYRAGGMVELSVAAAAGALVLLGVRAARWGASRRRLFAAQALGLALVAAATALALEWNLSILSLDSFAIMERGLALARVPDARWVNVAFLKSRGIFGALTHALTPLSGVEYLYFLMPVVSASFLATLATLTWQTATTLGHSRRAAAVATLLGVVWLASCYFVAFQAFYVHVNWLAAMYVLLFFHSAWMALETEDGRWFVPAAAALLAFILLRVEGAMVAALFLGLLALEPRRSVQLRPAVVLALPGVFWCLCVCAILGDERDIVDRPRLLLMAGALASSIALAWGMRRPRLRASASRLQLAMVCGLGAVYALMLAARPDYMLEKSRIHLTNAMTLGTWSTAWATATAFALAAPLLGRIPRERFIGLGIAGYLLLTFALAWFGPWRPGWWDSGNRMLTHVLPVLAWLTMAKAVAIAPARKGAGAGEPPNPAGGRV